MAAYGDTVAAIATAAGRGAVGIVRISGPKTVKIAERIVGRTPRPRTATLRDFLDASGVLLDRGLCLFFPGPNSYTGEDLLELHAHGGPAVLRGLLEACYAHGARPARPGEFTERAFMNGKIDLLQAEAVASLIDAATTHAASAAARACAGEFSIAVSAINDSLRAIRVALEASLDFAEETSGADAHARGLLQELDRNLGSLLANARNGARLQKGLDVAIVGRPNSGKSTLLNRLCGEERAIVTPIPGTTRDILSVDIDIAGLSVRLHDSAGLRDTDDIVEQEGVRRAYALLGRSDIVLHLCAINELADEEPLEISNARRNGKPIVTVINKLDLTGRAPHLHHDENGYTAYLSALRGDGLALICEALLLVAGGQEITDAPFIARARHVHALEEALAFVSAAEHELARGATELASEQLRLASRQLEEMTGVYTTEALLGDIFSNFCIGK